MIEGDLANLIQQYGYWMLFLIGIFEGPIVSLVGGFLSSVGILNLYLVYFIILFGEIVGDTLYYLVGYFSRDRILNNYGKYIGLPTERLNKLDQIFHHHGGKTLLVSKFLIFVGGFFLVSAGAGRMNYVKFIIYNIIGALIKTAILVGLGFYFGSLYMIAAHYFEKGTEILTLIVLITIALIFISKKILSKYIYKLN
ncbi:MAG: DedA family protein [bacterium]